MKVAIILAVLLLGLTTTAGLSNPLCGALVRDPEVADRVGITEDQREALEDLFESTEKEMISSRAQMRIKRIEIERLVRSSDPDMRQIRKLVSETEDARSSAMLARIERAVRTRQILTSEQMKKARRAIRRRAERQRNRLDRPRRRPCAMPWDDRGLRRMAPRGEGRRSF